MRLLGMFALFLFVLACDDEEAQRAQRCRAAGESVAAVLDGLDTSCEVDDDCVVELVDYGGCSEPFAAREGEVDGTTELQGLYRTLHETCPTPEETCEPPAGEPACRAGRCVVVTR